MTALGGTNAVFHCAGSGAAVAWEVDGLSLNHQNIVNRGITDHTVASSGTVQSNLTVPATSVNNGTTVRCYIGSSSLSLTVVGNYSTLTILPGIIIVIMPYCNDNYTINICTGIGHVFNVRFSLLFSAVLWDPPATVGVLSGLSYRVIVMNNNNTVVVNATTTNTNYDGLYEPCQYYTANVTAFSFQHHGESVVIEQKVLGGE